MDNAKVSVVIIAKNEEARIEECLQSVYGWADEIIVVDDESTDNTREIAASYADKFFVRKMQVQGRHRNWADTQASNEWIFCMDADERATDELKAEIRELVNFQPEYNGFSIPRRNHIGNYWVRWGGQYPSAQLRLFRKDKLKWEEVEVHPRMFLEGKCRQLQGDVIHYTYKDWADFLKKLNRQTSLEALKWQKLSFKDPKKARYKMNVIHALWRVFDRFMRTYFRKRGYRDGFIGFMIAYFASLYQIVSYAKYRELKKNDKKK